MTRTRTTLALITALITLTAGCFYTPGPDSVCVLEQEGENHGPWVVDGELQCDTEYPTVTVATTTNPYPTNG